jgi:hypothetical protein
VEDYFNNLTTLQVPTYFLSRIKLENATLNAGHQFETLQPGHIIDVRAFVYAQEGSWIVIPGDYFDPTVKNNSDLTAMGLFHAPSRWRPIASIALITKSTLLVQSWRIRVPLLTTPMAAVARSSVRSPIG